MSEPALSVGRLSKKFCRNLRRSLWYGLTDLGSELVAGRNERNRLRRDEFWALQDVSFEVARGETLGLIGHNGAGKSTLLKLLNGLIKPDQGRISVRGQVGALIELGAGFNPILTGRENIHVNAAVLGLSRDEVKRRFDEIVDFAEIGDFIDAPVRTYSSGMKVRLGFSVAAHLNPDVLLVDEVLSVGDSSFRERCINRMNDYKRNGGTVVFVSHNSVAVEAISDRVLMLDHGKVAALGEPFEVVGKYEAGMREISRQAELRLGHGQAAESGNDDIRITSVQCYDMAGNPKSDFDFGEPFEIRVRYETKAELDTAYFAVGIRKGAEIQQPDVTAAHMLWDDVHVLGIPRRGTVGCVIEAPPLSPGMYTIRVAAQATTTGVLGKKWLARPTDCGTFFVVPGRLRGRLPGVPVAHLLSGPPVIVAHSWRFDGKLLQNGAETGAGNEDSHLNQVK